MLLTQDPGMQLRAVADAACVYVLQRTQRPIYGYPPSGDPPPMLGPRQQPALVYHAVPCAAVVSGYPVQPSAPPPHM